MDDKQFAVSRIVSVLQECLTKVEIIADLSRSRHEPTLNQAKKDLQHVLESTINEMQSTGTFPTLKQRVATLQAEESARKQEMSSRLSRVRSMRSRKPRRTQLVEILNRSVRKLIATNKEKHETDLELMVRDLIDNDRYQHNTRQLIATNKHETDLELANLMDDREEKLTLKDMQVSYNKKWYHAKSEQNMFLINKKLSQHQQQILSTSQQIEQEHRVANEIINFLRKSVQDLNDQLDWWKQKYETDLEEKQEKLNMVTLERDQQLNKLQQLTKMYNERKAEIEEYDAIKAEIKRKQDFETYQNKMATKIQAWWRGIMVRRHLGQFKDLARRPKAKIVKLKSK
uniref:Dynein regulatory complex protein 9 n=1 Tax=Cacopsylla melanoneura TaxID=428564 RepID=A0A8D8Z4G5_9HEMI